MTDQRTMGHRMHPFTSDSFFSTIVIVVGTLDNEHTLFSGGKTFKHQARVCIHLDRDLHPKLTCYHIPSTHVYTHTGIYHPKLTYYHIYFFL